MKKLMRICIVLSMFLVSACSEQEYSTSTDINKYEEYIEMVSFNKEYDIFPNIEELPDSVVLDISYVERTAFLIRSKTLILTITVPENIYSIFKEEFLNRYDYFDDLILDEEGGVIIPKVEFEYLSYTLFVVNNEEFYYPENFGMVGFSDENFEIIILMYFDIDRDRVSDMNQFIYEAFLLEE